MKRYAKAIAALTAGIGEAITIGLATGTVKDVLVCVLAALGAISVYQIPNAEAKK